MTDHTSSRARRLRLGLMTIILLASATVSCLVVTILADRYPIRLDVTGARTLSLAERTQRLIDSLEEPHEIIVVADLGSLDPRARERIDDVLTEYDRASALLSYSLIDVRSNRDEFVALLDRLATMRAEELEERAVAAAAARDALLDLNGRVEVLSQSLEALADALPLNDPLRAQMQQQSAIARTWTSSLAQLAERVEIALASTLAGSTIPAVDEAARIAYGPLKRMANEVQTLGAFLEQVAGAYEANPAVQEAAETAAASAEAVRLRAASSADDLERLGPLDIINVIRAFESGPATVIVSDSSVAAVRFDALFPSTAAIEQTGAAAADLLFTGEELIASALASMNAQNAPVVVIVHGQLMELLNDKNETASPDANLLIGGLAERLSLRQIELREWRAGAGDEPPALPLNEDGADRPVVWAIIGMSPTSADAADRMGRLAGAARALFEQGESLLISVDPSTLPSVGEPDPMVDYLVELGVRVDSGRPLMTQSSTPLGAVVTPGSLVISDRSGSLISESIRSLPVLMPWALPISIDDVEGVSVSALIEVEASDDTWAEAEWLGFRTLSPTERSMLRNPPTPDPGVDDVDGPWTVATAIERRLAGEVNPQRIVVVGANGWFFDEFTQSSQAVDGRTTASYPGNRELLEASIYWLAHQDEMIAPGAQTIAVARIGPVSDAGLLAIRWGLIAGMPLLVLFIGACVRLMRG